MSFGFRRRNGASESLIGGVRRGRCRAPGVEWGAVAGLQGAKDVLQENVALPLALPHLFTGIRRPVKVPACHCQRPFLSKKWCV